jgi:hypothetical protein
VHDEFSFPKLLPITNIKVLETLGEQKNSHGTCTQYKKDQSILPILKILSLILEINKNKNYD